MATTLQPSPVPTPTSSNPPTPPMNYPAFPRLSTQHNNSSSPSIQRNASTSSSRSTTTTSSTSSLMAVPIRPPPIETRTAATTPSQLPSRAGSVDISADGNSHHGDWRRSESPGGDQAFSGIGDRNYHSPQPQVIYGGRGFMRNGPRMGRQTMPIPPSIVTSSSMSPATDIANDDDFMDSPTSALGLRGAPSRRNQTVPIPTLSPTTPKAITTPWADQIDRTGVLDSPDFPPRVTITDSDQGSGGASGPTSPTSPIGRGRGFSSIPSSPTISKLDRLEKRKQRTLSVDAGPSGSHVTNSGGSRSGSGRRDQSAERNERDRRMSQASNASAGGGSSRKPSIRDYQIGEELGRGSYSTVVRATSIVPISSSRREFAIKIINQAHLVQEKKTKYAVIERDALIRLAQPRPTSPSAQTFRTHRRGHSGSSSNAGTAPSSIVKKRPSTATGIRRDSTGQSAFVAPGGKDRSSIATSDSSSSTALGSSIPLSPTLVAPRMPWRTEGTSATDRGDEESPIRRTGSPLMSTMRSAPPSPVKEESSSQGHGDEEEENLRPTEDESQRPSKSRLADQEVHLGRVADVAQVDDRKARNTATLSPDSILSPPEAAQIKGGPIQTPSPTPKKRRQSLAPSERSVESTSSKAGQAHPGIIRLFQTFNDNASLYFVLDLAVNGELLSFIRKYGSLDLSSARFYAAQLIDTIEFMHDRGVIHRDLKPENILLDEDMRIKVTDFGSAKLTYKEEDIKSEDKKRSFVGSADFVSPEVLRNEEATLPSDIWAFGCILYQFIVGKPPFRGATDYLTFQKILKREMEYPADFDDEARELVESILNLEPTERPNAAQIKAHAFFASIDFASLWNGDAPTISTGISQPVATLATVGQDSDLWAVFDDEVSDGGFEYDNDDLDVVGDNQRNLEPRYDRQAAEDAVRQVDRQGSPVANYPEPRYPFQDAGSDAEASPGDLEPPRPSYVHDSPSKRGRSRLGSRASGRTSSSSSTNRHALSGLLESIRLQSGPMFSAAGSKAGSSRNSRTSDRSAEIGTFMKEVRGGEVTSRAASPSVETTEKPKEGEASKWNSLLLGNERIIFSSSVLVRPPTAIHLPSFLLPNPKKRQLILTDFPRLITVKEEINGSLSIKAECVFLVRGSARSTSTSSSIGIPGGEIGSPAATSGGTTKVVEVQDKGPKGFIVQTLYSYLTDTADLKREWITAIKRVQQ